MAFSKQEFIQQMAIIDDGCIHFTSAVSGKEKYTMGTLNFETPYVRDKLANLKTNKPKSDDCVLIFSWDTDSFKQIDPASVLRIEPLSHILQNDRV